MISPYLTRYRHGEYLQYMKDVLELVKAQDVDALLLTEPTQSLTLKTAKIEAHKVLSVNDAYAKLLDKLAVLTTQYNQLIDNRTTTGGTPPAEPADEAL